MREATEDYTHEKVEFEILTELQHYGGYTNLIDFTTDSHIALFSHVMIFLTNPVGLSYFQELKI